jgi:hypothetical protein
VPASFGSSEPQTAGCRSSTPDGTEVHPLRVKTPAIEPPIVEGETPPFTDMPGLPHLRMVEHEERGTRVAADYEIRIKGRVGDSVLLMFEGLTATTEPVETVLYGPIPDQEALHKLLGKLQSLGLEITELRRLPGEDPDADPGQRPLP